MGAGHRMLDVCCGTGGLVLHCARLGIRAAGVDMDPRVIAVAEQKREKRGLGNASFQVANALNLPFESDLFDYASISMSIHEVESAERDRIIAEMRRVVRAEGALVFIDYKIPLPRIPSSYTSRVVELVAGRPHNRCFRDYMQHGGLNGLLQRNGLCGEKVAELGPMAIVKAANSPR